MVGRDIIRVNQPKKHVNLSVTGCSACETEQKRRRKGPSWTALRKGSQGQVR
jgi:hypothetical protein